MKDFLSDLSNLYGEATPRKREVLEGFVIGGTIIAYDIHMTPC